MELSLLIGLLLAQVLLIKGLERLGTVGLNLFFDHLHNGAEALQVKLAGSIALAAGEPLFVDLSSFALEAWDVLFNALFVRI